MDTYTLSEYKIEQADNSLFALHSHDEYEILIFLKGDSHYIIEDKTYLLEAGDVIIIRKHEMHRIYHNSNSEYHRIVIMVSPEFFKSRNCSEYENAFLNPLTKKGNKINSEIVHSSGLHDAIVRLKKYSDNFKNTSSPVVDSVIVEILYIINSIVSFTKADVVNKQLKPVISYINNNFTEEITLDTLSEKFFISKFHLCRIFREATGLTIQGYVKSKRLLYAKELIQNGMNMTEAAMCAGFNNYSSFYRAYKSK